MGVDDDDKSIGRAWPPVTPPLPVEVALRDGTPAEVRAGGQPGDREALVRGFDTFSAQSRYRRFLTAMPSLSEAMVRRLVDEIDGSDHIAVVLTPKATASPVGVARMIRSPSDPSTADVAVSVADDWQGRGVATALLAVLVPRRPAGTTTLVTEVAVDNAASLAMLRRLGPTRLHLHSPGTLEVRVDLAPNGARQG